MPEIPREKLPDSTLSLLLEGYEFIPKRCQRFGTDLFETRLLLQKTICMTGADAAQVFYDEARFQREGAAPARVQKTLFGEGGVQSLDGEQHRHHKHMFTSLMMPENIDRLAQLSGDEWQAALGRWERSPRIALLDEAREVFLRAVCAWAGVPLAESDVPARVAQMADLVESGGTVGPKHWRGRLARRRAETWAVGLIRRARTGEFATASEWEALGAVAQQRDLSGQALDERVAAVELLNVIRPTVAVARFVAFLALALHSHSESRAKLEDGQYDPEWFVQEVRRFYPFFPSVAARVRDDFEWHGYRLPAGRRVLLDLYGTNRDPRAWEQPDQFRPERFQNWDGNRFTFVPQGGGDYETGHRCPGEWITIELMKVALRFLMTSIRYDVPPQDLRVSLSKMPAAPNSGFVIGNVRRID